MISRWCCVRLLSCGWLPVWRGLLGSVGRVAFGQSLLCCALHVGALRGLACFQFFINGLGDNLRFGFLSVAYDARFVSQFAFVRRQFQWRRIIVLVENIDRL